MLHNIVRKFTLRVSNPDFVWVNSNGASLVVKLENRGRQIPEFGYGLSQAKRDAQLKKCCVLKVDLKGIEVRALQRAI